MCSLHHPSSCGNFLGDATRDAEHFSSLKRSFQAPARARPFQTLHFTDVLLRLRHCCCCLYLHTSGRRRAATAEFQSCQPPAQPVHKHTHTGSERMRFRYKYISKCVKLMCVCVRVCACMCVGVCVCARVCVLEPGNNLDITPVNHLDVDSST